MIDGTPYGPGAPVAHAVPAHGNPAMLALPAFLVASVALGFNLLGWYPAAAGGALVPLALVTALFLLIACVWSTSLGDSYSAGVQGVFSAFWLGYAVWTLGAVHSWFGVPPADLGQATQLFLIAFLIVALLLVIGSLRGPLVFTIFIFFIMVAVVLILLNTVYAPSTTLSDLAGLAVLIFCVFGGYMYLSMALAGKEGPALPMGAPLLK